MSSIPQTVDSLVQAFQEFKTESQARFSDIEKSTNRYCKSIEMKANRPILAGNDCSHQEGSMEKTALRKYVTKGDSSGLLNLETKGLSVQNDSDGGFLIPEVMSPQFDTNLSQLSVMRQLADVTTISTSALDVIQFDDQAQVGWAGETDAREETATPKVKKKTIAVHEMYARPKATQKLLDDSVIDIENWLTRAVAQQMARAETEAFLLGNGPRKPRGIFSYDFKLDPDAESFALKESDEVLAADDLIQTVSMLAPRYTNQASWLMSRSTLATIRQLKDNNGRYLWESSYDAAHPDKILGFDVHVCDEVSGGPVSILFGDFKAAYKVVDRQGIYVLRDPYSSKPYVEFYTTKRVGGDVVDFRALVGIKTA